jgi:hypothetical protein
MNSWERKYMKELLEYNIGKIGYTNWVSAKDSKRPTLVIFDDPDEFSILDKLRQETKQFINKGVNHV